MDAAIGSEPLLPYVVALIVAGVTLLIVGVVLVATSGRRAAPRRPRARGPWTCEACGTANAPDRDDCYACHAPRPGPHDAGEAEHDDGEPEHPDGEIKRDDAP